MLRFFVSACGVLFLGSALCLATSLEGPYTIVIKDHRFEPAQLTIPAGKKIKLIVENQDATEEEFESYELDREKMVEGGKQITIYLGPLKPGSYPYFGDLNSKTAQGIIVAQ